MLLFNLKYPGPLLQFPSLMLRVTHEWSVLKPGVILHLEIKLVKYSETIK